MSEDEVFEDEDQPRMIDVRCIAGLAEIADIFGVSKQTASNWHARRDRNGYPEAIAYLACGAVFDINEVIQWYGHYIPLKGGRPGRHPRIENGQPVPAR